MAFSISRTAQNQPKTTAADFFSTLLAVALKFSAAILDCIDSVKRLSHIATVAALTEVGDQAWRTREEHARSPNWGSTELSKDRAVVHLNPAVQTRSEFSQRADELAHDLMVLLRRELKQ